jgi:hypothetical protein
MATITVTDEMRTRFDEQMSRAGAKDASEYLEYLFEAARGQRGEDYEDLDDQTREAIEAAEDEYRRGLGQPLSVVRTELEAKFGKPAGLP